MPPILLDWRRFLNGATAFRVDYGHVVHYQEAIDGCSRRPSAAVRLPAIPSFDWPPDFQGIACRACPFSYYNELMQREQVIRILSEQQAELAVRYGVKSLSLFGSVARDEAVPTSDVDLLVEFDRPVGYFGLFALQDHLESLLGCKVDLGTPDSLKPRIRARVLGESVRVA
jgi:uncharacterized protein